MRHIFLEFLVFNFLHNFKENLEQQTHVIWEFPECWPHNNHCVLTICFCKVHKAKRIIIETFIEIAIFSPFFGSNKTFHFYKNNFFIFVLLFLVFCYIVIEVSFLEFFVFFVMLWKNNVIQLFQLFHQSHIYIKLFFMWVCF